jgi:hypothetical protein
METALHLTENPIEAEPTDISDSADVEFRSSLRLLAERAAFLTGASGVSIVLREQGILVPTASAGSQPSPSMTANPLVRECLEKGKVLRLGSQEEGYRLIVPVKGDEGVSGLIKVAAKHEFTDHDQDAVVRLADLVSVVREHREAARRAASGAWEADESVVPQTWHAPVVAATENAETGSGLSAPAAAVRSCGACGFPVSPGRVLCVECEQKTDVPVSAPPELFSMQKQESWLAEHGYTVASLIVSALAAVIIFWLRK